MRRGSDQVRRAESRHMPLRIPETLPCSTAHKFSHFQNGCEGEVNELCEDMTLASMEGRLPKQSPQSPLLSGLFLDKFER